MKISFNPFRLVTGGLQVINRAKENIERAEEDGKVDKKELGNIILSGLMDVLAVLAAAMYVDDKPVFSGDESDDEEVP